MVWSIDFVLRILSIMIGLVSVIYGVLVAVRFSGKFKTAAVFLLLSIVVTLTLNFLHIFKFPVINLTIARSIGNLIVTIFILLTVLFLRQIIECIDNHYSKK